MTTRKLVVDHFFHGNPEEYNAERARGILQSGYGIHTSGDPDPLLCKVAKLVPEPTPALNTAPPPPPPSTERLLQQEVSRLRSQASERKAQEQFHERVVPTPDTTAEQAYLNLVKLILETADCRHNSYTPYEALHHGDKIAHEVAQRQTKALKRLYSLKKQKYLAEKARLRQAKLQGHLVHERSFQ